MRLESFIPCIILFLGGLLPLHNMMRTQRTHDGMETMVYSGA
jgi:hypothetical protein